MLTLTILHAVSAANMFSADTSPSDPIAVVAVASRDFVDAAAPTPDLLERLYAATNSIDQGWYVAAVAARNQLQNVVRARSTSVGDIMRAEVREPNGATSSTFWMVADAGFIDIAAEHVRVVTAEEAQAIADREREAVRTAR